LSCSAGKRFTLLKIKVSSWVLRFCDDPDNPVTSCVNLTASFRLPDAPAQTDAIHEGQYYISNPLQQMPLPFISSPTFSFHGYDNDYIICKKFIKFPL
jgi:hypothetical protein